MHIVLHTTWTPEGEAELFLLAWTLQHQFWNAAKTSSTSSSSSSWSASGCVVECRICNREVADSNLSLGYFAPRSTQAFHPSGVPWNEYQLQLGRQRQVWLIPNADKCVGLQVKLWNPLRTRAIPEHFCGGDSLQRGATSSVCSFTFMRLYHQQYFCDIFPSCLHPSLSSFECNIAIIICRIPLHLNSSPPSCWFSYNSAFNNFMRKSIVSQNMANPSMLALPNRVQYLPIFIQSFEKFNTTIQKYNSGNTENSTEHNLNHVLPIWCLGHQYFTQTSGICCKQHTLFSCC